MSKPETHPKRYIENPSESTKAKDASPNEPPPPRPVKPATAKKKKR